jgi:hypothetical protein
MTSRPTTTASSSTATTSNADTTFPFRDDEILIAHNSIEADENGIAFFGQAEDERHDIMIRDNTKIHGHGGHGIAIPAASRCRTPHPQQRRYLRRY